MQLSDYRIRKPGAYSRLAAGAALISFSAVFVKMVPGKPVAAGFYRMLFGGLFLLVISLGKKGSSFPGLKPFFLAVAAAFFFTLDLSFWHRSIYYLGPGVATILANFQVIILALAGILFLREKVRASFLFSVPLALLGISLLCGSGWSELPESYRLGIIFGLTAAVCYAVFILILRYIQIRSDAPEPVVTTAMISLATAVIMLGEGIVIDEVFLLSGAKEWIVLIAYGLLCQGAGWVLITGAVPAIPASRTGLVLLLQPALSMVWDIIFFNRETTSLELLGAVLAIAAIYLGSAGEKRKG